MITALVTLLIMHFSGGPGEVFLVPNAEKNIKAIVKDKDKKGQAVELFKSTKKEVKAFDKDFKQQNKRLKKDDYRNSLGQSGVEQLLAETFDKRKDLQNHVIDQRLKIRQVITEEEWDRFIETSMETMASKEKKTQKAQDKRDIAAEKLLEKIRSSLQKSIADTDHRNRALADFADFEKIVNSLFEETNALTFENNPSVQSYDVSKKELKDIYSKLNNAREQLNSAYLMMRKSMSTYLSEDEWNAISKKFLELL